MYYCASRTDKQHFLKKHHFSCHNNDEAVNLISKETREVVQAPLCPYLMTMKFGSINESITIANPCKQLKTFVCEKYQLLCLLNDITDVCQIAFLTKNFGNKYFFKLGEYNKIMQNDHQEVTECSSLLTTSLEQSHQDQR